MKSRSDQLDLFGRPIAQIIAFPGERMIGAMRLAAVDVLSMPAERQPWRLAHEAGLLRVRLIPLGLSPREIERHTKAYRDGVEREMSRLLSDAPGEHGGAA